MTTGEGTTPPPPRPWLRATGVRVLLPTALGALAATGFEPLRLWFLALLSIAGLLALLRRATNWRQAALAGWLFGVGHFTVGNNWIATAFTYQAEMPAWLGWLGVFLLALYLAVYPALATLAAWLIARGSAVAWVLALAGTWIVTEWLRGWVFTGYAWNPLAMVALGEYGRPGLASIAPWLGTYALSGVVVAFAGMWAIALLRLATLFDPAMRQKHADIGFRYIPKKMAGAFLLVALPILVWTIGAGSGRDARPGTLRFTLVQPDVRQDELDNEALYEAHFIKTARLTYPARRGETRLVLWPESGIPDYLREGYPAFAYNSTTYNGDPVAARRRIGGVIGEGSLLLTGAVDLVMQGRKIAGARNAITAVDASGTIRGGYAKAHLVPYGEYLPMRGLLEPLGLSRLVAGSLDFLPGPGPRTLDLGPWGKAGMQICYEIVFSGEVVDPKVRPDYLFNPSNDGWFGAWGPPQHLAQARMRAIEEGLPVLRATTTGISAVIDGYGVVRQHIGRHRAARLDGIVPPALPPTLFARFGNALGLAWAAVFLVLSLVALRRSRG
jgi:apolipoprotein N-acyltransferase